MVVGGGSSGRVVERGVGGGRESKADRVPLYVSTVHKQCNFTDEQ